MGVASQVLTNQLTPSAPGVKAEKMITNNGFKKKMNNE